MNTQNENQDAVQNSAYNPFPEPRTIPTGWDTSALCAAEAEADAEEADNSAEN
jgi:hypothetical protein